MCSVCSMACVMCDQLTAVVLYLDWPAAVLQHGLCVGCPVACVLGGLCVV